MSTSQEPSRERFWDGYFRSLKPLEVEETIDVWVHRPPAYLLARMLFPTPISPNMVTVGSIVLGCAAGVAIFAHFPGHLPIAGLLVFLSAVVDCADGMLARLRKSSSAFGRMLDGVADLVVSVVVAGGGAWLVVRKFPSPTWHLLLAAGLCTLTIVTSSFHTAMYDYFKNVFLHMTHPSYSEGEDVEAAEARNRAQRASWSFVVRVAWVLYFFYVKSQRDVSDGFDPGARKLTRAYPTFSERGAAVYRARAGGLMRLWRTFFGFGSLVFGLAVSIALDVTEYYLLYRLVLLNALFYGYMRPAQRRATELTLRDLAGAA